MSWLALVLLGVAVGDLVRAARPHPVLPAACGALATVVAALLTDLTGAADVVAVVLAAGVAVVWSLAETRVRAGRLAPWVPLAVLGGAVVLALLASPLAGTPDGALGRWLRETDVVTLAEVSPQRALVVGSVFLLQLSAGNSIVRLALLAGGTIDPETGRRPDLDPSDQLPGGRLLGPMERVLILGLGLAGHVTAASLVIAAKGLVRFPELQSKRGRPARSLAPHEPVSTEMVPTPIDKVTEYFLVGSFLSWLLALGSLVLASG